MSLKHAYQLRSPGLVIALCALLLVLLTGCGKKGPLKHPAADFQAQLVHPE